jgi:hypothetical protein
MNIHSNVEDTEYLTAIELRKRPVTDDQFHKFENYAAEIFSAFGLDLNTSATKDTPRRFIKALFDATEGYEGDPQPAAGFRRRMSRRTRLPARSGDRRSNPLLYLVRAPRSAILWHGIFRLHRSRAHHWHLQAHPACEAFLLTFCSTGTDRPANSRCLEDHAPSTRSSCAH